MNSFLNVSVISFTSYVISAKGKHFKYSTFLIVIDTEYYLALRQTLDGLQHCLQYAKSKYNKQGIPFKIPINFEMYYKI